MTPRVYGYFLSGGGMAEEDWETFKCEAPQVPIRKEGASEVLEEGKWA
jgi:hypothetical protein